MLLEPCDTRRRCLSDFSCSRDRQFPGTDRVQSAVSLDFASSSLVWNQECYNAAQSCADVGGVILSEVMSTTGDWVINAHLLSLRGWEEPKGSGRIGAQQPRAVRSIVSPDWPFPLLCLIVLPSLLLPKIPPPTSKLPAPTHSSQALLFWSGRYLRHYIYLKTYIITQFLLSIFKDSFHFHLLISPRKLTGQ